MCCDSSPSPFLNGPMTTNLDDSILGERGISRHLEHWWTQNLSWHQYPETSRVIHSSLLEWGPDSRAGHVTSIATWGHIFRRACSVIALLKLLIILSLSFEVKTNGTVNLSMTLAPHYLPRTNSLLPASLLTHPPQPIQPTAPCCAITAVPQPGRDLGMGRGSVGTKHPIASWVKAWEQVVLSCAGNTVVYLVGEGPEVVSCQRQSSFLTPTQVPCMSWGRGLNIFGGCLSSMSWDGRLWEVKMPSSASSHPVPLVRTRHVSIVVVRRGAPSGQSEGMYTLLCKASLHHSENIFMPRSALSACCRLGVGGEGGIFFFSLQPFWIWLRFASSGHLEASLGTNLEIQMCNLSDSAYRNHVLDVCI